MKPHPRLRSLPFAFTVVELLVVVAILGILAAVLVPTVASSRARAVQTKDLANLRQIAQGIQLYVNDNSGAYPTMISGVGAGWEGPYWTDQISPYLPREGDQAGDRSSVFYTDVVEENHHIAGYGANSYVIALHEQDEETGEPRLRPVHAIADPAKTILVANAFRPAENSEGIRAVWFIKAPQVENDPESSDDPRPYPVHPGETFAAVFCDGHAEAISFEEYVEKADLLFGERPW